MLRSVALGSVMLIVACAPVQDAPTQAGVCWRSTPGLNGRPDFRPLASGVDNLETCAARLEGLHLQQGVDIVGAYQGRFIYVDRAEITAATRAGGHRYRVFSPEQRARIRQGYAELKGRGPY